MSLAVSAELRAELARQGYNVQSFARHSNLPASTLHKTLKGQRVVDVEDLFNICDALGIDPGPIVDRASQEALRRYGHGILWEEGDPAPSAGERGATVHHIEFPRAELDDQQAAASDYSDDRGEDGDYDA
ncbi:MAG: helix-turn-helix transcriptional regulator [Leucobacter sp.]